MNEKLLMAFNQQDTEIILRELTPLLYKYMKGVPSSDREDVFQELALTCVQVVARYDFSQVHPFL